MASKPTPAPANPAEGNGPLMRKLTALLTAGRIEALLDALAETERRRVLGWITDKYSPSTAPEVQFPHADQG